MPSPPFSARLGLMLLCSPHPYGTVIGTAGICEPFSLQSDTRHQVQRRHTRSTARGPAVANLKT